MNIDISTIDKLEEIAKSILSITNGANVYFLVGNLGSGKTTFTSFFAKHLGVDNIKSPTFPIMIDYNLKNEEITYKKLYHIDLYRLNSCEELEELDLEFLFSRENIVIIEWADKFINTLKIYAKNPVILKFSNNRDYRKLEIEK